MERLFFRTTLILISDYCNKILTVKCNIEIADKKTPWIYFIFFILLTFISCNNAENKETAMLPTGKWKVIQLKNPEKNIVLNSTGTYFFEHTIKNSIIITAEDNRLSGDFTLVNKDSIKINNLAITDVCCNSEAAKLLFKFFNDTIKYEQLGDTMILSSNKAVVVLEK